MGIISDSNAFCGLGKYDTGSEDETDIRPGPPSCFRHVPDRENPSHPEIRCHISEPQNPLEPVISFNTFRSFCKATAMSKISLLLTSLSLYLSFLAMISSYAICNVCICGSKLLK